MHRLNALRAPAAAVVFFASLTLWGCANLGLTAPQSFSQSAAYAYASNTALRNAATQGLNSGALTSQDASYVLGVSDQTRALLDAAHSTYQAGDVRSAEGRLQLALSVLDQLQTYLIAKGASP